MASLVRSLRWLCPTGLILSLAGCSLTSLVSNESVDYNKTVEDVTTTVLVTNILRARDSAPLFFSDISQLRGSFTASASASVSFPFGAINRPLTAGGARDSASLGPLTFSSNPSFDMAPLTTKQFTQGLLNSISDALLAYYLDRLRGNSYIALDLFISSIDTVGSDGETSHVSNGGVANARDDFFDALDTWTHWKAIHDYQQKVDQATNQGGPPPPLPQPLAHPPKIVVVSREKPFGPAVKITADTLIRAKTASLDVHTIAGDKVQFVDKLSVTTLCVPNTSDTDYIAVGLVSISSQKLNPSDEYPETNASCHPRGSSAPAVVQSTRYQAHVRSVEGMFYYLGYALNQPDPLLGFYLPIMPPKTYRTSVSYRGQGYYVPDDQVTLSVFAILNDLVNINRSADELPKTTAVQQVGGT